MMGENPAQLVVGDPGAGTRRAVQPTTGSSAPPLPPVLRSERGVDDFKLSVAVKQLELVDLCADPCLGMGQVFRVDLGADAVSPARSAAIMVVPVPTNGSRTVSPTKLQILMRRSSQFDRERCRVIPRRCSWNVGPNRAKRTLVLSLWSSWKGDAAVGLRYPPGFRRNRMYSCSFLMIAFGSNGLPRNELPFSTS